MKIGMLSSWDTVCGIAEYTRYLACAMWRYGDRVGGLHLQVLGSRNYDQRALPKDPMTERPGRVHNVFDVEMWNANGYNELDVDWILEQNFDVLHVQYEVILYPRPQIYELLKQFKGVKAITYHDNCILPDFPAHLFDLHYTHREDVGVGEGYVLPMGTCPRKPVVKTFGLGRSREDLIAEICYSNGWHFEKSFGEQEWKTQDALYRWLRDSDAIVLYYEEAPAAGSSIAARVAISTRRPVFVNGVTWFKELASESISNLRVIDGRDGLERGLTETLKNEYIERNSWDNIAETLVGDYKRKLSELPIL